MNAYLQVLLTIIIAIAAIVISWLLFDWYLALPLSVAAALTAFGYIMDDDRLGGVRA